MYSVELRFRITGKRDDDLALDAIYSLLSAYRMNGQLIEKEWSVIFSYDSYFATVLAPDRHSFKPEFSNKYVRKGIENLHKKGLYRPKVSIKGREIGSLIFSRLAEARWLILFTNYICMEPPLRSGNDFRPVPLYELPKTYDDEYNDIICWQSDYQCCDTLQMGCATGESFGTRELSSMNSSLTKRGMEICGTVTKLTRRPCYYYIYRGAGRNRKSELNRTCPGCGSKKWKLNSPLHGKFDFKCDTCKIISNIGWEYR